MSEYSITTLQNGLRVMTIPQKDALSATVMMIVQVGSRQEDPAEAGIAHFIEHNVFKGTTTRTSRNQIAEEIEGLGGVTNAATGQEYTYYWAKVAAGNLPSIMDVILDISNHMTFPEEDLEIERGNVIEEINMYQDNPMQRILRDYIEFVWDSHPVGRRIIGTKDTVGAITRDQMKDFVDTHYLPSQMLLVVAGKIDEEALTSQIDTFYAEIPHKESSDKKYDLFTEFQIEPRVWVDADETQQTHFCLGVKTFGRNDSRRFTLDIVNTVLGQGMSSRLFRRIREELGLAYYISSTNWEFEETGIWFAQAGVDATRIEEAITAVMDEFKLLASKEVGETELRKAKEFVKGKTILTVETSDDLAGWYGFQELMEEEILSPDEYNQKIEAVTAKDMQELVKEILREDRLNLGIVGSDLDENKLSSLLKF